MTNYVDLADAHRAAEQAAGAGRAACAWISASDFASLIPAHARAPERQAPCVRCGEMTAWSVCQDCSLRIERERDIKNERAAPGLYLAKSVPSRYSDAAFADMALIQRRVHGDEMAIATTLGVIHEPWVTFVGPTGAGKTTLAVAALRERVAGVREFWCISLAFRLANARIQHPAGRGECPLVERALRAPYVLIDDIGQESQTANNPIAEIIQERDAEDRPTWITTGLSRVDLGNRYGGGVARRILERSKLVRLGDRRVT